MKTPMMKSYFKIEALGLAVFFAFSCLSCQKESVSNNSSAQTAPTIFATVEKDYITKTSISTDTEGRGTIYWLPNDEINIFFGTSSAKYTSQNTSPSESATFSTTDIIGISEGASNIIWGLYPYNSEATCNGSSIKTVFPSSQYAIENSFDSNLYPAVAHSTNTTLHFSNICGGVKFSVSRDDIQSISFEGNNNEEIAGTMTVSFDKGVPSSTVSNGIKHVTLTPKTGKTFKKGVYYYIILPAQVFSKGFTMTFETESQVGTFNYSEKSVEIKRSVFGKKENIDTYATFIDRKTSKILYTTTDGKTISPKSLKDKDGNLLQIVSNTNVDGNGVIELNGILYEIGDNSFSSIKNLSSIVLPCSVWAIGENAFSACVNLATITIPTSIQRIDAFAFAYCNMKKLVIPSSVLALGASNSATNVKYSICPYCDNLEKFEGVFSSEDGKCLVHDGVLNSFAKKGISSYEVPNNVSKIGKYSFAKAHNLVSISIPSSVSAILLSAFDGCEALKNVTLCEGLEMIEGDAFRGCSNLSSISLPQSLCQIGAYAFMNSNLQSVTIPKNVELYSYAFAISPLQTVTIENGITKIDSHAFHGSLLASISIPQSVQTIDSYAFCNTPISSISLPNNLKSIGEGAFYNCSSLKQITLPKSLTNIYDYAFQNTKIESITSLATIAPTITLDALWYIGNDNVVLHYPAGADYSYWLSHIYKVSSDNILSDFKIGWNYKGETIFDIKRVTIKAGQTLSYDVEFEYGYYNLYLFDDTSSPYSAKYSYYKELTNSDEGVSHYSDSRKFEFDYDGYMIATGVYYGDGFWIKNISVE